MPDVVLQGGNAGQWNVTVTIYESDGTTLATVYADAGGSVSGANPLPKQRNQGDFGVDNAGNWTCYLPAGDYQVGVHPAGGSETKTPFTVAAAPVPDVGYELTSVYGSRADGDVPVWNAARGRLEWGAGGGGGGTSQPGSRLRVGIHGAITATSGTVALLNGSPSIDDVDGTDDAEWHVDLTGTDIAVTFKKPGVFFVKLFASVTPVTDSVAEMYLSGAGSGALNAELPYLETGGDPAQRLADNAVVEVRAGESPLTLTLQADGWYNGSGTDPGTYTSRFDAAFLAQRIA